jgi:hypothetical protein
MDGRIRLAWTISLEDVDFHGTARCYRPYLSYDMLLDTLSEAEGVTSIKDRYPINDVIRQRPRSDSAVSRLSALSLN